MKSLIMALFLFAVSLGNFVTAQINHFIQVPSPIVGIKVKAGEVLLNGLDETPGTQDDIQLVFNKEAKLSQINFAGRASLDVLLDQFEQAVKADDFQLLSKKEGKKLSSASEDPWGNPYQYSLVNRNTARIWSFGADGQAKTKWDQGVKLTVERPEKTKPSGLSKMMEKFRPERSWLEIRKQELGIATKEKSGGEALISRDYFVGGQVKLEGANYFWFFTGLMLTSAVFFVVVAKLYRPREYYHDEGDDSEVSDEEALSEGH